MLKSWTSLLAFGMIILTWGGGRRVVKFDVHSLRISTAIVNLQSHDPRTSYFMVKVMGPWSLRLSSFMVSNRKTLCLLLIVNLMDSEIFGKFEGSF